MNAYAMTVALGFAFAACAGTSRAEEKFEQKSKDKWKYEYKDEYYEVKRKRTSSGEYKEEVKCK